MKPSYPPLGDAAFTRSGSAQVIHARDAQPERSEMTVRQRTLAFLSDPNVTHAEEWFRRNGYMK